MLLHGAELANPDEREKFGFDTRFRVVARNIGDYTGEPIIEVEEMVVATPDFSFADYLEDARLPPAAHDLPLRGQLRRAVRLDFLESSIGRALSERGLAFDPAMLKNLLQYMRAVALRVPFAETTAAEVPFESPWDIERWSKEGYSLPLGQYAFDPQGREQRRFLARTAPETRALILSKVATFGEHPAGLGKFTRTMFARDLRRRLEPVDSEPRAPGRSHG
jgi:hypothetical protein